MLESNGFTVWRADQGGPVPALVRENRPDIILLDVDLGCDPDGFTVCQALKAEADTRHVPVIFLTANNDGDSRVKGLTIGGVDYITKPFNMREILLRLRIHINLHRSDRYVIEAQRRRLAGFRTALQSFVTDLSAMPESRASVYYEPSQEAGGDQYDVVHLGQGVWGYFIADISGHGNEAALLSTVIKALFRENASLMTEPEDTFRRINAVMRGFLAEGQLVTGAYLTINQQRGLATLVSAAHLPVLVSTPDGRVERWAAEGDVIGAFAEPVFMAESRGVQPGTRFWLLSDGIVEDHARGQRWKAGLELLEAKVAATAGLPLEAARDRALGGLFTVHPGGDDRLLMVCEARP
jgi:sigma-B regulation protein RsbU (phosphoserine phosphatase)